MYLIDGHNLIPKIPGWSLRNIDDEQQLIDVLQVYCQTHKRDVEVFFDRAPVGFSGAKSYGPRVKAHFVRTGRTADEAIRMRLEQLGRAARNVVVISSDRQVQQEAHSHGAQVISSDEFAHELIVAPAPKPIKKSGKKDSGATELSPDDLEEWLQLFREDDEDQKPKK